MTTPGIRLGILQRVLADYRVSFFDLLAETFPAGVEVAAGDARPEEQIVSGRPKTAGYHALENIHIMNGGLYLCQQRGAVEWLEAFNPDALIAEANPRYLATPQVVRWMHRHKRPVVGWGLGAPSGSGLRSSLRLSFLREFDAMLTYSRKGKSEYAAAGLPEEAVFIAPNAAARRPTGDTPPSHINPATGQATVLFVGRLQARKRVDILLQACAALEPLWQPRLVIVGDGPERAALEELASRVYPASVFTGDLRGEALDEQFKQADLFALPGTGGLALQQALSFGLPAIAAEGDGTQADLVRRENGWLVTPGSLENLTSVLREALMNRQELKVKGQASFRIVKDEINLENMVAVFEAAVLYARKRASA